MTGAEGLRVERRLLGDPLVATIAVTEHAARVDEATPPRDALGRARARHGVVRGSNGVQLALSEAPYGGDLRRVDDGVDFLDRGDEGLGLPPARRLGVHDTESYGYSGSCAYPCASSDHAKASGIRPSAATSHASAARPAPTRSRRYAEAIDPAPPLRLDAGERLDPARDSGDPATNAMANASAAGARRTTCASSGNARSSPRSNATVSGVPTS